MELNEMENESDEQTVPVRTLRGTRLRGGEKTNLPTANTVRATEVPSFWCVRSYRSGSNIPSQMMGAFQGVHVCTSSLDLGNRRWHLRPKTCTSASANQSQRLSVGHSAPADAPTQRKRTNEMSRNTVKPRTCDAKGNGGGGFSNQLLHPPF